MATESGAESAIRDLVAVAMGTIATYRALAELAREGSALVGVLAGVGHADLADALTAALTQASAVMDRIGDLVAPSGERSRMIAEYLDAATAAENGGTADGKSDLLR